VNANNLSLDVKLCRFGKSVDKQFKDPEISRFSKVKNDKQLLEIAII